MRLLHSMSSPYSLGDKDITASMEEAIHPHVQAVYTLQMNKRGIRNGFLTAAVHVQSVYTPQMSKGSIHNGCFTAEVHVKGIYALQMNKCGICQLPEPRDIERLNTADVLKGGVRKVHWEISRRC